MPNVSTSSPSIDVLLCSALLPLAPVRELQSPPSERSGTRNTEHRTQNIEHRRTLTTTTPTVPRPAQGRRHDRRVRLGRLRLHRQIQAPRCHHQPVPDPGRLKEGGVRQADGRRRRLRQEGEGLRRHRHKDRRRPRPPARRVRKGDPQDRPRQGLHRGRRPLLLRHQAECREGPAHY